MKQRISFTDAQMEQERNDPKWMTATAAHVHGDLIIDVVRHPGCSAPTGDIAIKASKINWHTVSMYRLHNSDHYKDGIAIDTGPLSAHYKLDAEAEEGNAAIETLSRLGYKWNGGQLWKPPIGPKPDYIAWKGEGNPPVKTVCEIAPSGSDVWMEYEILGYYGIYAWVVKVGSQDPSSALVGSVDFRPILTPKQRTIEAAMTRCSELTEERQDYIRIAFEYAYDDGRLTLPGESE